LVTVAQPKDAVVVPLRVTSAGIVDPVVKVRSTLLASSVLGLRERGLMDRYLAALPKEVQPTILETITGQWLDVKFAMDHYRACETLGLSVDEQFASGWRTADRIQNSVLGTLVRAAKKAGVTPWTGLEQFQRLWDRLLLGGSAAVYRMGPKDARVEIHGVPMVQFEYFRNGWRGMFGGSGQLFASRVYVHEIATYTTATRTAFRISWA
jgi:hypothetical protein